MARKFNTREEWLVAATSLLSARIQAHGATLPESLRVSCGFPSKGGLASRKRVIGECWHPASSGDGSTEVFVSPTLGEADRVLGTLAHELVHAALGTGAGHGPKFRALAVAIGLTGKMTATVAGPEFLRWTEVAVETLGDYPHATLQGGIPSDSPKKQGTRMVKCECPECGYIVRTTQKWLDVATPGCPSCEVEMKVEERK